MRVCLKMRILRIVFALLLTGGFMSGCGKEQPKGPIAVFTADSSVVIARVGERDITVGDFRRRLDYETAVHKATMMKAKKPPKDAEKRLKRFAEFRARQILPQLVHCALLDRYLDASCGGREVEGAKAALDKALKHYAKRIRHKGLTLEGLAKELSVEPAYLRDQLILPAREDKARLTFAPASTNVTEKEIDEGLARMDAYAERAIASNRVSWAACSNALAKVRAGADFESTAKAFGADAAGEAKEWGWFGRDDFDMMAKECPQFKEWAFAAKDGEIGGPFDLDDGLSVVKVLKHQTGSAIASMATKQVEEVLLVRMTFPMVVERPEPRTREHCREALLNWKARDAQRRLFEKLFNETEITYPNGTKMDFKRRNEK